MSSDAKGTLATTIRGLRTFLIGNREESGALHHAVEGAYRMSVRARDAGLGEVARMRRTRLEEWIEEQVRIERAAGAGTKGAPDADALRLRFRADAEKQAAYTLVNRLVILRLMEAAGLRAPAVVTGGWESAGYKVFRQVAPGLINDDTEGYAYLLELIFDDLAIDLPGLFGPVGIADLVPVPAATLRRVVEALDDPELASCWTDDMTLGWVYQYWNDPERESLDAKINPKTAWGSGKIEPHEIASKTQMFTERYMVDWLLQNSLGPMWLAACKKHGWTADVERQGVLDALEARRVEWRRKRDAGEVSLTDLMPLQSDIERCWAYYLPQPLPDDAVEHAPESVRGLKILDPAVGSGHFLVVAFDLLFALYQEEARHRGLANDPAWQAKAIVESILENNLHGVDLDVRAVQIAAAALWLKAKQTARAAAPRDMNLVASALRLANLPDDDEALVDLRKEIERDTGIPAALTDTIVHALRGADHIGSLLKVDRAVDDAIRGFERGGAGAKPVQMDLLGGVPEPQQLRMDAASTRASVLESLERFLDRHTSSDELGLRLHGEQLAAGVRFLRLMREGTYDLVVGNPPYQGTVKMKDARYVAKHYPKGKADLYAAFLERGLQLVRVGGTSALLTMRNWMFTKQFAEIRHWLLETYALRTLGDFNKGAFESIPDEVVSVVVSVFQQGTQAGASVALQPTALDDNTRDNERTNRKRAATLAGVGRHVFESAALRVVPKWPLVYWWNEEVLRDFAKGPLLISLAPAKFGLTTGNNPRFVRTHWEVSPSAQQWAPFVFGAEGQQWCDQGHERIQWQHHGFEVRSKSEFQYGTVSKQIRNADTYFRRGVAFSAIGAAFTARLHAKPGVMSNVASSMFPDDGLLAPLLCLLNSSRARRILQDLNPTIHFEVGDVNRLPFAPLAGAEAIVSVVERAFAKSEGCREASSEFRSPSPSPWRHAQEWAQLAVDRPAGEPLPPYVEELDSEPPTDHLSFALGVALGRFGARGEGILDPVTADFTHTLPAGLCFLDGSLDPTDRSDSLGHPACSLLHETWSKYPQEGDLRTWLRTKFFGDVHKSMYESRPIHWPLSSEKKTFVAWVNIHRMNERTLRLLLADHLEITRKRLDGELTDLRAARDGADKQAARNAERRFAQVQKAREELLAFIKDVETCAERGARPTDSTCKPRERDARYAPDLDDGVMINSAAVWPLLEPQWKDPKKWWKDLSNAAENKDYDWSHLAMRYWPTRVDEKCRKDPSLGVAHGCFWRYHPERAWAWELRLQDEIGSDFCIEEKGEGGDAAYRARYLKEHPTDALEAVEKEALRRLRKRKAPQPEMRLLETGFWSSLPESCWALELRISEKQGEEFFLRAPDEAQARTAFLRDNPSEVTRRKDLVARLKPLALLPGDKEADEDADDNSEAAADDDAEASE